MPNSLPEAEQPKTHEFAVEETDYVGSFDGDWISEENAGRSRSSFRVSKLLHSERSPFQQISVYQSEFFGKILTLDDLLMLTQRDEFVYHEMLTHLPMLSHESIRRVLIIGGGDCGCLREVLKHPIDSVIQCEIDERVTRVCEDYFPWVTPTLTDPRVQLVFDDGFVYLEQLKKQFDLVIVDSTDPTGAAADLFKTSFYKKIAKILRPGGIMVAQTETPHWEPRILGQIHAQQRDVFQQVHAYLGFIPSYPSGSWSWSYATNDRQPADFFDSYRAEKIETNTLYYNSSLQNAAFSLPNFMKRAIAGDDPFAAFVQPK